MNKKGDGEHNPHPTTQVNYDLDYYRKFHGWIIEVI